MVKTIKFLKNDFLWTDPQPLPFLQLVAFTSLPLYSKLQVTALFSKFNSAIL